MSKPTLSRCRRAPSAGEHHGFSLPELLIVVALILVLTAIVVPSFFRSRMAANEASAVGSIRSINTAEATYQTAYPSTGYPATLSSLGGAAPCSASAATACLVDNALASGTRTGYTFVAVGANPIGTANTTYSVGAAPLACDKTGVRRFCSLQDQVIRVDNNAGQSTTPPDAPSCSALAALP